jgi:hypothetical protein
VFSSEFDMDCNGCANIPFWRWIKRNQQFPTSITCSDYDGKQLSNLQASDFFYGHCVVSPSVTAFDYTFGMINLSFIENVSIF